MSKDIKSLYIHIPFCDHLCDYCDFPKLQYFRNFAEKYIKALKEELCSHHINDELETIYVGGGTPTALDDDLFLELLKMVEPYSHHVKEYTFEANPESLSLEKLQMMKEYGVNRLSIGVESTDDEILKLINRHHTFKDVQTAILRANSLGFDNLNVDLIIGLPHVNKDRLSKDIDNILALDVQHISCYSLTVHPNTVFFLKGINEPDGDYARELYDLVEDRLIKHGYVHYEVSNWSKPGFESKHNFTYWKNEQYYGFGLGAAGYIDDVRCTNTRNFEKYCNGDYIEEKEVVDLDSQKSYQIMLNLRTNKGIDLEEFKAKYSEDLLCKHKEEIDRFIKDGLLTLDKENRHLVATYHGMMILDQIIMELID